MLKFLTRIKDLETNMTGLEAQICKLESENRSLSKKLDAVNVDKNMLKRIIRNWKPNEVTYKTDCGYYDSKTSIYKDGYEYIIGGLKLENPQFTQADKEDVLYIRDETDDTICEYVVDLSDCSCIKTKDIDKEELE